MTKQSNQNIPQINTRNFNDFTLNNDYLVYVPTGEIVLSYSFMVEYHKLSKKLHRQQDEFYLNTWNKYSKFTKLYTDSINKNIPNMSVYAKALFLTLIANIEMSTGVVSINNSYYPTNKELSELSKVSINKVKSTLEELVELNLIYMETEPFSTANRIIVVSPYKAFNGKNLLKKSKSPFENE